MNPDFKTPLDFRSKSHERNIKPRKHKSMPRVRFNSEKKDETNSNDATYKSSNIDALLQESAKYINAEKKPSASFYLHKQISNDSLEDEDDIVSDEDLFNTKCSPVVNNNKFDYRHSTAAVNMNVKKQDKSRFKKSTGSTLGNYKPVIIDTKPINPALIGGPFGGPPSSKKESLDVVTERRRSLNRDILSCKSGEVYKVKSRLKNETSETEMLRAKKEKERHSRSAKCRSPPLVIPAGFVNIFDGDDKYKCPILNPPVFKNVRSKSAASRDRNKMQSQQNKEVTYDPSYTKADSSKHKIRYYEDIDAALKTEISDRVRSIEKLKKQQELNKAASQKIRDSLFENSYKNWK